jgi:2-(1,2-epoxy-1,2-dihydrophenyl)acetyl-CoA isomerase
MSAVVGKTLETGSADLTAELADEQGRVLVLTLNRPERRNALSDGMLAALATLLDRCEADAAVRCIVLTGSGSAFCAGGDVREMAAQGGAVFGATFDSQLAHQRQSQRATVARIYRMSKPVIAALPGAAAGAGMGLCMACDFRIAADSAIMTTAFAGVGLSGDYGLPWLLAQQLGRAKALELLYFSEKLSAEQCLALGLVNRVVPEKQLRATALEFAARLANGPSVAYGYIKENINAACNSGLEEFMDGEVIRQLMAAGTADHLEAVQAFVEKRPPHFKGC